MATDLLIEVENKPGALARVAAAISDAGVNISAATCTRPDETAVMHILVKHAEAAKHALSTAAVTVTREREVVVFEAEDRPGVLADLARKVAEAGINIDLLYVATNNRIVFGSPDLDGLRRALGINET
ncbi:MAG TPA: ACT domain-containing protein [Acidimicrobiales bacterium]